MNHPHHVFILLCRSLSALAIVSALAASAAAQGNPTGTISGHVIDAGNLPVPGATVTVSSPVLQGTRTAVTSANGDYIVPFLPAGDYDVTFELQGFQTVKRTNVSVKMAETLSLDVTLPVAAIAESITVTGQAAEIVPTATIASDFKKENLERLPVGRTLNDAVLLAPAVAGTGPSGNIMMAGALSVMRRTGRLDLNQRVRGRCGHVGVAFVQSVQLMVFPDRFTFGEKQNAR